MGLRINSNIDAMNAYRNLSVTNSAMSKALEKLSSGYRINRAADDAAGLAISEGLRSQIGGLKVAARNTQDGINVVQTADGALNESTAILQRMRDLSVQAANDGGLDDNAKQNIQTEMDQLNSELTRIAKTTTFNGKHLLDGNYTGTFQVGANAGETITVSKIADMSAVGLGLVGVDVTAAASNALQATTVNAVAGTAGSVTTNTVDFLTDNTNNDSLNGTVSVGGKSLELADVALADTSKGWADASNIAALQSAADAAFGTGVVTVAAQGNNLQFTGTAPAAGATPGEVAAASVTFSEASGASEAITKISDAITKVSTARANLGAYQNRFEHTINNINVAVENLSASESSIRDTDMAQEMTEYTKQQILQQAGTAMLAQANQAPQGVLQLLRG